MAIITLISDWGLKDYYVAAVKGKIHKLLPEARVIDITHEIPAFDEEQAAYVLKNAYQSFPDGTIHIIGVNTEESSNHPHIVTQYENQFFIGTDNGIFSLIFEKEPEQVIVLDIPNESDHFTFSGRDRFVSAAVHLAKGGKISELGEEKGNIESKMLFNPVVNEKSIRGQVVYIDRYENLITNISRTLFREKVKNNKFTISLRSGQANKIYDAYDDVPPGEIVALFSSDSMLEIAINKGHAASLLGIQRKFPVIIEIG
ncbi:MAG: SAM-dependent chlorinase/fluorinase [bacterium]|jgi:S-adenosyl-L-methionine hydrolase (adenosine-forming)